MTRDCTVYHCEDLIIEVALGRIRRLDGASVRLSPINMAVLTCLIKGSGDVVSRASLFDQVWPNQVINDDVLTRAISDLRQQLKAAFGSRKFIETLPKRGYRWVPAADPVDTNAITRPAPADAERAAPPGPATRILRVAGRLAVYFTLMILIASAAVWIVDIRTGPALTRVAVLPIDSGDAQHSAVARQLDEVILAELMGFEQVALISDSAIASRPSQPFPYLYSEFGAVWVVESRLQPTRSGRYRLTISVVDAQTAIVAVMRSMEMDISEAGAVGGTRRLVREIQPFLETRPGL